MEIEQLMQQAEKQYEAILAVIKERTEAFETEVSELNLELHRLQGEYRAYKKILDSDNASENLSTEE